MPKKLYFSCFIIKIIALISMTFDHIGYAIAVYYGLENATLSLLFTIFRFIGRLSLPLFCFLIVEGVLHTSNFKKYLTRLLIMLGIIFLGQISFIYIPPLKDMGFPLQGPFNIFIDLTLGAIGVYFLKQENYKLKFVALLPLLYCMISFMFDVYEGLNPETTIWVIPYYIRTASGFYGVVLCLGFYAAYIFKDLWFKYQNRKYGINEEAYKETVIGRFTVNIFALAILIIITTIYFLIYRFAIYGVINVVDPTFSIFSGAFILLYSGKRGYNKNWFKYGCYIYYPLHLLIIFGIFELLSLL